MTRANDGGNMMQFKHTLFPDSDAYMLP